MNWFDDIQQAYTRSAERFNSKVNDAVSNAVKFADQLNAYFGTAKAADQTPAIPKWVRENPGTIIGGVLGGAAAGLLGDSKFRGMRILTGALLGAGGGRLAQQHPDVARYLDEATGSDAFSTVPMEDKIRQWNTKPEIVARDMEREYNKYKSRGWF